MTTQRTHAGSRAPGDPARSTASVGTRLSGEERHIRHGLATSCGRTLRLQHDPAVLLHWSVNVSEASSERSFRHVWFSLSATAEYRLTPSHRGRGAGPVSADLQVATECLANN